MLVLSDPTLELHTVLLLRTIEWVQTIKQGGSIKMDRDKSLVGSGAIKEIDLPIDHEYDVPIGCPSA